MQRDLPTGTVTLLFTDVEGSTRLLDELGAERFAEAIANHRRLIREACASHNGVEVDTQGDAFFFAFPTAPGGLAAAGEMTAALASGSIDVRIGLHTGTPLRTEEGYVGPDVHRAARIAAAGHGGQVLVSQSTAALVEVDVRDLGEHRLKDLSGPERIYQLGDDDFPPLKTLHQTNLPIPPTPFLGREKELGEVVALLVRDDVRLLTLTGPGGTGKSRLAAQAAGAIAERYPHGVFWVPLALLRDPTLVLESAAQVLSAKDGVVSHIADKKMLLLFDNFEQVVEAASDLASLLGSCPNLDLLVTSREPLHVTGEQEYAVPPLAHEEGVGFFLARARAVDPDFTANPSVSEICRRLDDLPLALELAAARVKALSPEQILERLKQRLPLLTGGARDLPERQRTLRATIEWSYELLTPDEQQLLRRFSVFAGGGTLDAAEEVCDAELDDLQSLVEKSLAHFSSERYRMLETIREYAGERLEDSGEPDELRSAHAEWFLALAKKAAPELYRPATRERLRTLALLDAESDNLNAALEWAQERGGAEAVDVLARALAWHWLDQGHVSLGIALLETALERCTTAEVEAEIRALLSSARFSAGDGAAAFSEAKRAYELVAALGPSPTKVWVLGKYANLHLILVDRDPAGAVPLGKEALAEAEALGDHFAQIGALRTLGLALVWSGALDQGLEQQRAALDLALSTGDPKTVIDTYEDFYMSVYLHPVARRTEPRRIAEEMLIRMPWEHERWREYSTGWLPWVFIQSGEWDRAEEVIGLASAYLEGFDRTSHLVTHGTLRWMQGRLHEARSELADVRERGVNPRWYHDYYPLVADIAADEGRLADVRAAAEMYLSVEVDPSEEAKKLGVLSPLARAETDAALTTTGSERAEHVRRAKVAVATGHEILEKFPPPTEGSIQMETPTTYLALAEAELSRATGPDPAAWQEAVGRADYMYFRLYARWRLAEALFETEPRDHAEPAIVAAHVDTSRVGADRLREQLEALAARAGIDVADFDA